MTCILHKVKVYIYFKSGKDIEIIIIRFIVDTKCLPPVCNATRVAHALPLGPIMAKMSYQGQQMVEEPSIIPSVEINN